VGKDKRLSGGIGGFVQVFSHEAATKDSEVYMPSHASAGAMIRESFYGSKWIGGGGRGGMRRNWIAIERTVGMEADIAGLIPEIVIGQIF